MKTNRTNLHKEAVYTIYNDRKIIQVKHIKILKQYFYLSNISLHSWSLSEHRTLKSSTFYYNLKPRNLKCSTWLERSEINWNYKSATTLMKRFSRQLLKP